MRRPLTAFLAGLIVGPLLLVAFLQLGSLVGDGSRRMHRRFQEIRLATPKSEVIRLMGSVGRRSDTFGLGQRNGFEFEYRAAAYSGAAYFLSWHTGIDLVYTVAFDQDDKAIYKASGGT